MVVTDGAVGGFGGIVVSTGSVTTSGGPEASMPTIARYSESMRQHLRRWGAFWIVLFIWLTTWVAYGAMEVLLQGAESHDPWVRFATGTLENVQSEAWFGIIDTLIIVGLAHKLFQRAEEDQKTLQTEVAELRRDVARLSTEGHVGQGVTLR